MTTENATATKTEKPADQADNQGDAAGEASAAAPAPQPGPQDFDLLDAMSAANNLITVSGKATSYNAVSNFYKNLSDAGYFENVTLGRTYEVPEGVQFSLTCQFSIQATVAQPAAATATSGS